MTSPRLGVRAVVCTLCLALAACGACGGQGGQEAGGTKCPPAQAAQEEAAPRSAPDAGHAPPETPAHVAPEEPTRPVADPPDVAPAYDDETEGLDLAPFEGSGPTAEEQAASGTIGGSFVLPRPFPNRRSIHAILLRGRGAATQSAADEELAALGARALAAGGWSDTGGDEPDDGLTALGALAFFSVGDAWTGKRAPPAAHAALKRLSRDWTRRGRGEIPRDQPTPLPPDLRSHAIVVAALAEWRGFTWTVYAQDEGELALRALRGRVAEEFPEGSAVVSDASALDAAWALVAVHTSLVAEFTTGEADLAPLTAALGRAAPRDERAAAALAVARAIAVAFHRPGATRDDVRAALAPALAYAASHPAEFERASDLMFLTSVAAMQAGDDTARDWNRSVLRPLAARPRATTARESALAAMCLTSPFRYSPASARAAAR